MSRLLLIRGGWWGCRVRVGCFLYKRGVLGLGWGFGEVVGWLWGGKILLLEWLMSLSNVLLQWVVMLLGWCEPV